MKDSESLPTNNGSLDHITVASCTGPITALQVQTILTPLIAEGAETTQLIAAFSGAMNCTAVFENSKLSHQEVFFEALPDEKEFLATHISLRDSPFFKSSAAFGKAEIPAARITDEFSGLTLFRIVASVAASGERLGFLSLLRTSRPFDDDEAMTLGYAANLFAVNLMHHKRIAEVVLRLKGNFVDDLVSLRYSDPESILSRASALDFNLRLPHHVLVGEIDNIHQVTNHLKGDPQKVIQFWTDLVEKIQSRLDNKGGGMVIHRSDEIIMLVCQAPGGSPTSSVKVLSQEIIDEVAKLFKAKLYIGIGTLCSELSDYQKSYQEAKKALEIGTFMLTEGQVRSFEQFKIHALFLSTLKPEALYDYARSQLGALLDYDALHETEFLKTLQEFLYLRNNIEKTARSLSISVSGLKYRLQKIEQILMLDLKDYKVCFDLQLALIILQLFGEYRIK